MMLDVSSPAVASTWHVIVPVRGGRGGKSRLTDLDGRPLTEDDRVGLALAMAADTVAAAVASGCGPVHVVTADAVVSGALSARGAEIVPDQGRGLNAELLAAAESIPLQDGVLILLGDVPTVLAADLQEVIDDIRQVAAGFVPDWEGTGTALLGWAPGAERPALAFGTGSAARHESLGFSPVGLGLDRLRCDVDTPAAWARAVRLGLGPATAAASERIGQGRGSRLSGMAQGSVHTFDQATGAGSVLLDDGTEVPFSPEAFERSGLRLLRAGQRVSLDQGDDGAITRVFITGIGDGETIR